MASTTKELNFAFYFVLIKFNLKSPMWPVVIVWESTGESKDFAS